MGSKKKKIKSCDCTSMKFRCSRMIFLTFFLLSAEAWIFCAKTHWYLELFIIFSPLKWFILVSFFYITKLAFELGCVDFLYTRDKLLIRNWFGIFFSQEHDIICIVCKFWWQGIHVPCGTGTDVAVCILISCVFIILILDTWTTFQHCWVTALAEIKLRVSKYVEISRQVSD